MFLDHCFARIILDNAIGVTKPWTEVVKAPATKHMTASQFEKALKLGSDIQGGKQDLKRLDEQSLAMRGKTKGPGQKRKRGEAAIDFTSPGNDVDDRQPHGTGKSRKGEMADLWEKYSAKNGSFEPKREDVAKNKLKSLPTPPTSISPARSDECSDEALAILKRISSDKSLTPFRKRVLSMLTQVPPGRYTTYKALSETIAKPPSSGTSSARAIGSAMRNNPFAPVVPCHRVLAANGKIGGFGGDWGEEGRFVGEKRRLLKEEGVRFDGRGTAVGSPFTDFV